MKRSKFVKEVLGYLQDKKPSAFEEDADQLLAFFESKGMVGPDFKDRRTDSLRNAPDIEVYKDAQGKFVISKGWETE